MQAMIAKVVDFLMDQPGEVLMDKDNLIVGSVVKSIDALSKIQKIAYLHRYKDYTEAKKEDIARELSKVLFYTSCLTYLCEIDTEPYEADNITELSESFPPDIQADTILCCMDAMKNFMDMSFLLYSDMSIEEGEELDEEEMVGLLKEFIADIFASVFILCDRCELDLEAVMHNATIIDKF